VGQRNSSLRLEVSAPEGSYIPPSRSVVFKIHGQVSPPKSVISGNETVDVVASTVVLDQVASGTVYDSVLQILWIKVPDRNSHLVLDIRTDK
jgi:hypothetical protein